MFTTSLLYLFYSLPKSTIRNDFLVWLYGLFVFYRHFILAKVAFDTHSFTFARIIRTLLYYQKPEKLCKNVITMFQQFQKAREVKKYWNFDRYGICNLNLMCEKLLYLPKQKQHFDSLSFFLIADSLHIVFECWIWQKWT